MKAYEFCDYVDDVTHFGVKGMKWGIINEVKDKASSKAKKVVNTVSNKAKSVVKSSAVNNVKQEVKTLKNNVSNAANKIVSNTQKGFNNATKKASGVASNVKAVGDNTVKAARTILPVAISDRVLDKYLKYKDLKGEKKTEKVSDLKKKSIQTSLKDDVKACNNNGRFMDIFTSFYDGRSQNCQYCTANMELRRRGYDTVARNRPQGGSTFDVQDWFKDPQVYDINITLPENITTRPQAGKYTSNEIKNLITNNREFTDANGNGRGYIDVEWWCGGGHAFYWESNNGVVTFCDGQNGQMNVDSYFSMIDYSKPPHIVRLDNLELNDSVTESCRSRK